MENIIFLIVTFGVGVLISCLRILIHKLKLQIEFKEDEIRLLKHNLDLVSRKYYEIVNSDKCKKCRADEQKINSN